VSGGWWLVASRLCFITNLFTNNKQPATNIQFFVIARDVSDEAIPQFAGQIAGSQ